VIIGSISILPSMYQSTIFGTSVRPWRREGGAFPDAPGDELKRPRRDLGAGRRHADDDRNAPAAMTGFQRLAHHCDIAGAVEAVVGAADLVGALLGHMTRCGTRSGISFGLTK